jgi:hypothetical protein
MRKWNVFLTASVCILLFSLSSCLEETTTITDGNSNAVIDPSQDPEQLKRMICDPFDTNSPQDRDKGLFGSIYHLVDGQPRYKSVEDYINNGTRVDAGLYLDRLFVKTRPFDRGFVTRAGTEVQIDDKKLFEYFAIDVDTQLQLGDNEQPGYYQLALLSDDGALLKSYDQNGSEYILVNNNGTHPTRMACATEPVYMDRNTRLPVKLQYYQGPRYHIALIAMWRPWPVDGSGVPVEDPHCGKNGNGYFFDFAKDPIEPKKPFYELLERNWKVLENENYEFPDQEENPCAPDEELLLLTGFSITAVARNSVSVTWNSNIPASSQVEVKNVSTGAIVRSSVSLSPVTTHNMSFDGLAPNTLYSIRAISSTVGGQTVITDERAFRTPR